MRLSSLLRFLLDPPMKVKMAYRATLTFAVIRIHQTSDILPLEFRFGVLLQMVCQHDSHMTVT